MGRARSVDTTTRWAKRVRYVGFEGIEGAGKSSVVKAIADRLRSRGDRVTEVREPGGTGLGEKVRGLVLGGDEPLDPWAEAALFAASRAQLAAEVIRPALASGSWVLSDRTVYSSLAYQGGARGLGVDEVRGLNAVALNGVWPDLVVWIDVPIDIGLERQEDGDRIGLEGREFHERVSAAFQRLADAEPDRVVRIDGSGDLDATIEAAWEALAVRST